MAENICWLGEWAEGGGREVLISFNESQTCGKWLPEFFCKSCFKHVHEQVQLYRLTYFHLVSVQAGVGNIAINDFLLIEATIYKLLKKHIRHKPYYVDVLDLFHEVSVYYSATICLCLVPNCCHFQANPRLYIGLILLMFSKVGL